MPAKSQVPAFIVHDRAAMRAVFDAAGRRALRIESPVGFAGFAGAGFWAALLADARTDYPQAKIEAVLDCGEEPGTALAAIRAGVPAIRCRCPAPARARLAALARAAGVAFIAGRRPKAHDLSIAPDAARAVTEIMAPRRALKKPRSSAIPEPKTKPRKRRKP